MIAFLLIEHRHCDIIVKKQCKIQLFNTHKNISLPAYAAIIIVVKYFEGSLHVVFQVAACPDGRLNVSAYRAFIEFCTSPEEAL